MKRIIALVSAFVLVFCMSGCVTSATIKSLPGQDDFFSEMKEIDKDYKIKTVMNSPDILHIDITSKASDIGTVSALFEKTVTYLCSDEVYAYMENANAGKTNLGYIKNIDLYLYFEDDMLLLASSGSSTDQVSWDGPLLLNEYNQWGISIKKDGVSGASSIFLKFTEDGLVARDTGEPVNWDAYWKQLDFNK